MAVGVGVTVCPSAPTSPTVSTISTAAASQGTVPRNLPRAVAVCLLRKASATTHNSEPTRQRRNSRQAHTVPTYTRRYGHGTPPNRHTGHQTLWRPQPPQHRSAAPLDTPHNRVPHKHRSAVASTHTADTVPSNTHSPLHRPTPPGRNTPQPGGRRRKSRGGDGSAPGNKRHGASRIVCVL